MVSNPELLPLPAFHFPCALRLGRLGSPTMSRDPAMARVEKMILATTLGFEDDKTICKTIRPLCFCGSIHVKSGQIISN